VPAAIAAALILLLARLVFGPPADQGWVMTGETMGTSYSIQVSDCTDASCETLGEQITQRLAELVARLSHFDTESELYAFNQHEQDSWFYVSEDLLTVVEFALGISAYSDGAFDITVAPSVNAWGFGPAQTTGPPDENQIRLSRAAIGFERLATQAQPPALRKTEPTVTLDLSALAKGYAVDQLAFLIEESGNRNYLVEIGGEIRAAGLRPDGGAWRIGIQAPDGGLDISFIISPGDEAIATSGDYRNFYFHDGKRISHTIDPAKGKPVTHNLASVSVIAPSAMQADALATLMMVVGADKALQLAQHDNIPVLLFVRDENRIDTVYSDALNAYIVAIQ
jgi:thiamine biosynthesis lipoprotein